MQIRYVCHHFGSAQKSLFRNIKNVFHSLEQPGVHLSKDDAPPHEAWALLQSAVSLLTNCISHFIHSTKNFLLPPIERFTTSMTNLNLCNSYPISACADLWAGLGPSTVCACACSACLMRFGWPGRVYLWFTSYIRAGSCSWCRSSSTDEMNPCQPHYPNLMNPHESFIRAELLETRRLKWRMCTYLFMSICPYLPLVISKARVPYGRAFCPNAVMQSRAHTSNRDVKNPLKLC